ncbi:hypothetical protein RRG08_049733 [Elysia crispata]|uniref:Uncharacterized protein n=1 Tax=Elysia crispata TaxID=231223 RepID=A0AAE0Y9Q5_9GAST|nr:hypothetical protein RRG08_049733 [Elysia crispata]
MDRYFISRENRSIQPEFITTQDGVENTTLEMANNVRKSKTFYDAVNKRGKALTGLLVCVGVAYPEPVPGTCIQVP